MTAIQNYLAPTTLAEALEALAAGGAVTILAGGTDVMPQSQIGRLKLAPTLLNIRRIAGLGGIAAEAGGIRIGALATITELLESDLVRAALPVLWSAADQFASPQIRNAGTIGGNICNASPAGDTLPALLVLDAAVELTSTAGRRRLPLKDFFVGPGKTRREPNELLTAVLIPTPAPGFVAGFAKFGARPALDIATVAVAIAAVKRKGMLSEPRVAFGAVAPTPVRGPATEAALAGKPLDAALIEVVAQAAHDEVDPISDVRATAWYRREMIQSLTKKVLRHVAQA